MRGQELKVDDTSEHVKSHLCVSITAPCEPLVTPGIKWPNCSEGVILVSASRNQARKRSDAVAAYDAVPAGLGEKNAADESAMTAVLMLMRRSWSYNDSCGFTYLQRIERSVIA